MTRLHLNHDIVLLPAGEQAERLSRLRANMAAAGIPAMLVCDNANLYYLTGRVFAGYIFIPSEGDVTYFVRRPVGLTGADIVYIHKPEQIAGSLDMAPFETLGLELDLLPYNTVLRLHKAMGERLNIADATPVLRLTRSIKTLFELAKLRESGIRQTGVYRRIPKMYRPGMTDIELQVAIESNLRLEGCLGQFRIAGSSMELHMANIITGDNADTPTPYDFAMGGAGLDPSIPVGANGSLIRPGSAVMVDANGNFTGYMTDMTRTFTLGDTEPLAVKAHQTSIDICAAVSAAARPGVKASDLYHMAEKMAAEAGLGEYFMGHRQKAGFIGHGVGIEINELPVIAPRSRDIIAAGQVIALEPKFVIPGVGAVGIENTYYIGPAAERLTNAPEELIQFLI